MTAMFDIQRGTFSINVPHPAFTDLVADGWTVGPRSTDGGTLTVVPWSPTRIDDYHYEAERWAQYGERIAATVQAVFQRRIRGGVVGEAMRRLEIPRSEPHDRSCLMNNITVDGGGARSGFRINN